MATPMEGVDAAPAAAPTKGKVDYSKIEAELEEQAAVARQGKLSQAVEAMLNIEKTQRLAADAIGTKMACVAVVRACAEAKAWPALNENILLISKRRSQLKQAITSMVQECMTFLDKTPDVETKLELIKTLVTVSAGKIFVEVERARLTRMHAKIKEDQGKLDEAAEIMQEVAVETYGALSREEKIAFILEQIRLVLDRKDYVRAQILSKKITPNAFQEKGKKDGEIEQRIRDSTVAPPLEGTPTIPELKLAYYRLMIRYHMHNNEYLEACRSWQAIYESAKEEGEKLDALRHVSWLVVLAAKEPMQQSLLAQTSADKKLGDELPLYKLMLKAFTTVEILRWSQFEKEYAGELAARDDIFGGEAGAKRRADLRQRVTEHNVHVVAKYYARISFGRMAELLDLPEAEAEQRVCDMVSSKALSAKLDRPARLIVFAAAGQRPPEQVLNEWAGSLSKVLGLLEAVCHKIHKDATAHKVPIDVRGAGAGGGSAAAGGPTAMVS